MDKGQAIAIVKNVVNVTLNNLVNEHNNIHEAVNVLFPETEEKIEEVIVEDKKADKKPVKA